MTCPHPCGNVEADAPRLWNHGAAGGRAGGRPRPLPPVVAAASADGSAIDYARGLTALGPRLTGTAGYQRAVDWAAGQLRAAGVDRVTLDAFTIPDGWERVGASARLVSPEARPLHVAALGWTPSTPPPGVVAEVVAVTDLALDAVARLRTLDGRIALLPPDDVGGNPSTAAPRRRALDAALRRAGAVAILSPEPARDNVLAAHDRTFGATLGALPVAQISRDDGDAIRTLVGRGPVRVALDLQIAPPPANRREQRRR